MYMFNKHFDTYPLICGFFVTPSRKNMFPIPTNPSRCSTRCFTFRVTKAGPFTFQKPTNAAEFRRGRCWVPNGVSEGFVFRDPVLIN